MKTILINISMGLMTIGFIIAAFLMFSVFKNIGTKDHKTIEEKLDYSHSFNDKEKKLLAVSRIFGFAGLVLFILTAFFLND